MPLAGLLLILSAAMLACGTNPVPATLHGIGIATYAPVPSDALPIRQADRVAYNRLRQAVQGLRYTRAGGEFVLAGAAFTDAQPVEPDIASREVIQLSPTQRLFWVVAAADSEASLPEEAQLALQERSVTRVERFVLTPREPARTVAGTNPAGVDSGDWLAEQLQRAIDRSIHRALVAVYAGQTIPAHGRVFLVDVQPQWELAPGTPLPIDPTGDHANPTGPDGYRTGRLYQTPEPGRLAIQATVLIIPDVRLAD